MGGGNSPRPAPSDPVESTFRKSSDSVRRIHGREFMRVLYEAGVIPMTARRVVVDAAVDSATIVYVELIGDERMLKVATTLKGVEITREVPTAPTAPTEGDEEEGERTE